MVVNTVRPSKKSPVYINTGSTASMYRSCLRGLSCTKCGRRRSKEAMENSKVREKCSRKGTLLDAFRKAVNALDELDLVPRSKKPRVCRHRPAALTIYVRKRTEKVYNAIRLNQKTIEELKGSLGEKYNFAACSVTSFQLSSDGCQRQRRYSEITEEMVEKFEDEDDFLLDLAYDIMTGVCEVKLTRGPTIPETRTVSQEEESQRSKTS